MICKGYVTISYIVFELMEGDLGIITELGQEISEEHVRKFMYQIFKALNFMHCNGFIHRDLVYNY